MFTIKFYNDTHSSPGSCRQFITTAESFTILRDEEGAEITLHRRNGEDDVRIDVHVRPDGKQRDPGFPQVFQRAIIENAAGKTTEIIGNFGPK